jgi:hypothetical protein
MSVLHRHESSTVQVATSLTSPTRPTNFSLWTHHSIKLRQIEPREVDGCVDWPSIGSFLGPVYVAFVRWGGQSAYGRLYLSADLWGGGDECWRDV